VIEAAESFAELSLTGAGSEPDAAAPVLDELSGCYLKPKGRTER